MFVNRRVVRIEWADCDPAGIVYYPRYFQMFDTSTHHLFEAAGWKKADLMREFQIIGYDLIVETRITAFRNSSFDIEHRAFKPFPDGEKLAIEAFETRVWSGPHPDDPKRLKSRPIPQIVVRRLSEGRDGG